MNAIKDFCEASSRILRESDLEDLIRETENLNRILSETENLIEATKTELKDLLVNGVELSEARRFMEIGEIERVLGEEAKLVDQNVLKSINETMKNESPRSFVETGKARTERLNTDRDVKLAEGIESRADELKLPKSVKEKLYKRFKVTKGIIKFGIYGALAIGIGTYIISAVNNYMKTHQGCYVVKRIAGNDTVCRIPARSCASKEYNNNEIKICDQNIINKIYTNKTRVYEKFKNSPEVKNLDVKSDEFAKFYTIHKNEGDYCKDTSVTCDLCDSTITNQYNDQYVDHDLPSNMTLTCRHGTLAQALSDAGNNLFHGSGEKISSFFNNKLIIIGIAVVLVFVIVSFSKK